jgi:hypothetical protein
MHILLPICGKFTRALLAHQIFSDSLVVVLHFVIIQTIEYCKTKFIEIVKELFEIEGPDPIKVSVLRGFKVARNYGFQVIKF